MKKSIIAAGAASLAVAAMPIVGVFADDVEITDTLQITVEPSCTFKQDASPIDGVNARDTQYTDGSVAGGTEAVFSTHSGTHDFEFTCNNMSGFSITATPSNMTSWNPTGGDGGNGAAGTGTGTITFTPYSAYSTNEGISGGTERDGKWTAHITTTESEGVMTLADPTTAGTATTIVTKNQALGKAVFTATYKVYAGTSTPADTYRGTIVYNLSTI